MLNSCDRDLSNSGGISSQIHQAAKPDLLTEHYKLKDINNQAVLDECKQKICYNPNINHHSSLVRE